MADTIIFDGDTELEHYQVIDTIYEGRQARVLYSGQRHTAQSGIAKDGKPDLLFDYNQRFLELLESVPAERLLLIGGGAYTLPMALLHKFPQLQIDVVEIDAGLQRLAERFFGLKQDQRLHIIHENGRDYLEHSTQNYDVILLDAFTQSNIPESLTDAAAVRLLHKHLTGNGVAAVNIISPYYGPNSGFIRAQVELYASTFRMVEVRPAGRAIFSLWLPQNLVLIAQKGNYHELNLRYGKLGPLL